MSESGGGEGEEVGVRERGGKGGEDGRGVAVGARESRARVGWARVGCTLKSQV